MASADLRLAAARYVLGVLPSWELPSIADAVLDSGGYSPAVTELAMTRDPVMSDVGPVFEKALHEFGETVPSREEAVWIVLRHHIGCIAAGRVHPREGLRSVMAEAFYPADLHERTRAFLGDSHGIQHLIGCFFGYDDLQERPTEASFAGMYGQDAIRAMDQHVIQLCKAWLGDHGG